MKDIQNKSVHWDNIFVKTEENKLGWYEKDFSQTLKFLNFIENWKNQKIFLAGVGTSNIIDELSKSNSQLILNDISSEAINKARLRFKENQSIRWLCHDISKPLPPGISDVDIWIDRAVLHFLVDENSIEQYFENIKRIVNVGGYVLLAEFSKIGVTRCAGLDVRRYDADELCNRLSDFELIASEDYTFINPKGEQRPYIYALFRKTGNSKLKDNKRLRLK